MVFDLVVEPSAENVNPRRTREVAGCSYLLFSKGKFAVLIQYLHALMVGGKKERIDQAKHRLMDSSVQKRYPPLKLHQKQTVPGKKESYPDDLRLPAGWPLPQKVVHTLVPRIERLKGEIDENRRSLHPNDRAKPLWARRNLLRRESKNRDVDIRVFTKFVGMSMVAVMLVHPPVATDPEKQVTEEVPCN